MPKRKICIVTGARAEYGLLFWLMREIQDDMELDLQIIATGMHLSPEFGLTYRQIEEDGFSIHEKVEMLISSDTPVGIAKSIGLGVIGFADAFHRLKPDIIVILGDRFEIFAAAQAAMTARIPIAHVHGGESTEGAIDEAMRHAITKMSLFHFPAAELYRQRIIQMGESPERVMNFGAPGLDNLRRLSLLDRVSFEKEITFDLGNLSFLVTYHPVTLNATGPEYAMSNIFCALDYFPEARIIFTKANADTAGRVINQMIDTFVEKNPERSRAFTSLGQVRYLSALKHVDVVIGNSSSGLIEAPAIPTPTVNIGDRQQGRLQASSVISCEEEERSIAAAIKRALSLDFQQSLKQVESPYTGENTCIKIKNYLKNVSLIDVLMKHFCDLKTS